MPAAAATAWRPRLTRSRRAAALACATITPPPPSPRPPARPPPPASPPPPPLSLSLPRIDPGAFIADRLQADARFLQKIGIEVSIDSSCTLAAELVARGAAAFGAEWVYVCDDLVTTVLLVRRLRRLREE
jgi:hypothetical protein